MSDSQLSFNLRKSLSVHLGEGVGAELSQLLNELSTRVAQLESELAEIKQTQAEETPPVLKIRRAA